MSASARVVIVGGGFAGVYAAIEAERQLSEDVEITLISRDNFLLFTPMLHEVAASDLDAVDILNPIRKLIKRTSFFLGEIESIDIVRREVRASHGTMHHSHTIPYDHLVLALGSTTHFFGLPGLAEGALTMRSIGDALRLRNQMISHLEEADFECCKDLRERLLTFVVAGGGFAGVETVAAMHDFLLGILPFYKNLKREDLRVVIVHSGETLLPELSPKLGRYAAKLLTERGLEVRFSSRVQGYENGIIKLSDGMLIDSATLVWTAGNSPHPLLETLVCPKERGRVLVNSRLQAESVPGVWAVGDCAAVPISEGKFHPPTAQHAIREARVVAQNIAATLSGRALRPFSFKTLGQLASLGHRRGVAQILGIRFSGFIAWWLWRSIYLLKLPRLEKRMRVAASWTLDVIFSKDNVQVSLPHRTR